MNLRIGIAMALVAVLAVGCGKKADEAATGSAASPDTSALAQNNAQAPVAGSGSSYPTASQREAESKSLPPGTPENSPRSREHKKSHSEDSGRHPSHEGGGEKAPEVSYVTVPPGQAGEASLATALSSETAKEGDTFTATLDADWSVDQKVVVPAGSTVMGHVTAAESTGRGKHKASLSLAFDRLSLPGGETVDISAKPWSKEAEGDTKGDVAKIGGGAVVGGIIGALTGNTKRGVAIGGAAGTGAALASRGKPVELAAGSKLHVELTGEAKVPVHSGRS